MAIPWYLVHIYVTAM